MSEKDNKNEKDIAPNKNEIIKINESILNSIQNENIINKDLPKYDLNKYKNIDLIKKALTNLKNQNIENILKKLDTNKQNEEQKFLNIKRLNSEENENLKIINNINEEDKKENVEEDKKEIIEIIEENHENIDNNNNSNEFNDNSDIIEEDEESYSISSDNNSNTSINSHDKKRKLINKYRRRKEKPSIMKNKISNYFKSNKRTILKRKEYYVHQLLQRWWYALPVWPPENFDTSDKLRENKLRLVDEKNWKKEVELNSDNFKKCIELPGYKYVYLTKDGKIYDFRPEENKPTFNNLMKLNDIELHQYLVNALKKQLEELEKRNFFSEKKLRVNIRDQLKIAKINLSHIQN